MVTTYRQFIKLMLPWQEINNTVYHVNDEDATGDKMRQSVCGCATTVN